MCLKKFLFLIVVCILCFNPNIFAHDLPAESIELIQWRPFSASSKTYLLPKTPQQTPEEAIGAYLTSLKESPDLQSYLFTVASDQGQPVSLLPRNSQKSTSQVLLLANHPQDHESSGRRVHNFIEPFIKQNKDVFILPVGATLRLSTLQRQVFHRLLAEQFGFMVAMGGDDVDPHQYKKNNTFSVNTNPTRDKLEIDVIRSYLKHSQGFFWGVCRGHQITSVALGLSLVQDLKIENNIEHNHKKEDHEIRLLETKHDLLEKMLGLRDQALVNSFHHQAVNTKSAQNTPSLSVAALSPDGTIEALEFKNGRGLLTQFHPELMKNSIGELFMARISNRHIQTASLCRKIFRP